ncbi:MAG: SUMF1/EgtB/PvdO family nonheme iron enzyme [Bacteroides sp.]|nr:SUMF1/EgtB/PvdO family nonheme iron enzyme [Bacteroides sp.]
MKRILFVCAFCIAYAFVWAQDAMVVTKFEADPADLSAQVHQVTDLNGSPCGLVKVSAKGDNVTFEGDIIKVENKGGNEYWVYMIEEATWLMAKSTSWTEAVRYDFPFKVEKLKTYIMNFGSKTDAELAAIKGMLANMQQNQGGQNAGQASAAAGSDVEILPLKLNPVFDDGSKPVEFNMIKVRPGMFEMGGTPEQIGADKDEFPVHKVRLTNFFYMGETEVTQELWERIMGYNPSVFPNPQHPVENVTWEECKQFCEKLSELTKKRFRMPTEAEWEYVARGGDKTNRTMYCGSADPDEVAWYYNNSQNSTRPVKSKKPNELGFYDMSGNVWEMCWDYKAEYKKDFVTNPVETDKNKNRVRRGGGYDCKDKTQLRSSYRRRWEENVKEGCVGLRLVLVIDEQ